MHVPQEGSDVMLPLTASAQLSRRDRRLCRLSSSVRCHCLCVCASIMYAGVLFFQLECDFRLFLEITDFFPYVCIQWRKFLNPCPIICLSFWDPYCSKGDSKSAIASLGDPGKVTSWASFLCLKWRLWCKGLGRSFLVVAF